MPFNGAGVYSLYTPGNPVVTGTTISSTVQNNTMNDIATALSTCVLKDGTQTLTANIPMANFKLTGLGNGSAATDSAAYGQTLKAKIGTFTHDVSVTGTQVVSGLGFTPTYVIMLATVSLNPGFSIGFDDGTNHFCVYDITPQSSPATNAWGYAADTIQIWTSSTTVSAGHITATASGQFTVTWTKTSTPTGTATVVYLALGV